MSRINETHICAVCGRTFPRRDLIPGTAVRDVIAEEILRDHPGWSPGSSICREDLGKYRAVHIHHLLASEKGELSALETEVVRSIGEQEILSRNVDEESEQKWSLGDRLADRLADFGGSWTFLICFGAFLGLWIALNAFVLVTHPPDPYPFILLNLLLSCIAAVQAPIIMMSQNRQETKDRVRARHDYQVNLKAELEIRQLHDKIDHLLSHQWDRMTQIQEIQLDILAEMGRRG